MNYRELFVQAFTSLKANVMRTSLTMLGIIIGITSIILIVSIGQGALQFITTQLNSFGSDIFTVLPGSSAVAAFSGGPKNLTIKDADAIRNAGNANIESVIPLTLSSVPVTANGVDKTLIVRGVTYQAIDVFKPTITSGVFIREEDDITSSRVAVMGADTVKDFFGEDADPVGKNIRIDKKPFRIIGVAESSNGVLGGAFNSVIFVPTETVLNEINGNNDIQQIGVKVKNTDFMNQTIDDVTLIMRDRHNIKEGEDDDFIVQSFQDLLKTIQTITGLLAGLVAAVSGISLVVGGVGVMNIMLVTVTERTREIGLLKSIGAKRRDILQQFMIEAIVITLIGGIIGISLGLGGAFLITLFLPIPFVANITFISISVGASILIGIIFGLYPALRASRLSPIDALRYE